MSGPDQRSGHLQSFVYAFRGLGVMLRTERHARFHAFATILALAAAFVLGIERFEWLALLLVIAAVWSLEAVNTAIESLCNVVSPERHPEVARAKDVAAGAVLVAALAALAVAAIVFGRRILALLAS